MTERDEEQARALLRGVRFGRYELLRRLGRGGMAEVFLARYRGPESFEKQLVIKRIRPERSRDRAFLTLFFEEARLHVSLSHGNLVPVFDFGRVGNLYFIAMEYVRGADLGALLHKGPLSPAEVAYVGIELCRGLAYVHRRGLVHRDVTPRNVLCSTEGEVKLSDFGVALAPAATRGGGLRGTPAYMAPEQARGEPLDGRADLFALGLVLAEALTGRRVRAPRAGGDTVSLATAPVELALTGPLGAVLNRAAAPVAADRFADADEMLAALETVQKALPPIDLTPARALAARVAALADADAEEPVDAEASVGPATYFRDAPTVAEGIEQLHATMRVPLVRRRWPRALAGTLALAAIVGGALMMNHARHAKAPSPPVTPAAAPAAGTPSQGATGPSGAVAAPAGTTSPPTGATAAPTGTTAAPSGAAGPPRKRAAAPPRAETGSVRVQCTPWCVPLVDGQRRGDGARVHELELPPGKHRLGAQRLDDKQEREVDIQPHRQLSIDFTFQ